MEFRSLVQRVTTPFLLLSITGRFTGHSRAIFVNNRRIFRLTGRSVDQRLPTMSRLAGCGESDWIGRDASDGRRREPGEGSPFPV